ncbi:AEC family transporter [Jutongia sp.]
MDVFSSAFQQMLFMFLFMLLGYTLRKRRLIPENSSSVLSKLENLIFMPCLVLNTFMTRCTIDNLTSKITFLLYSLVSLGIALGLALILTPFFAQKKEERGIYRYSFMVANIAFMGNTVVEGIFGEEILFDYLMFTLPINLFLNSIGISWLMPEDGQMSWRRKWLGPINLASIAGVILGLTALPLPRPLPAVIASGNACMAPVAMILTGFIIGGYPLRQLVSAGRIYLVAAYRLLFMPFLFAVLASLVRLPDDIRHVLICAYSMPLGLNTIVIPAAYDSDTSIGASMAFISNLMALITIPLVFYLLL